MFLSISKKRDLTFEITLVYDQDPGHYNVITNLTAMAKKYYVTAVTLQNTQV